MTRTVVFFLVCISAIVAANARDKQTRNTSSFITRQFKDGDKRVVVLDNLFGRILVKNMLSLASFGDLAGMLSPWAFAVPDQYQEIRTANATNNIPWVSPINPEFFMSTQIWKIVEKVAREISGGKNYLAYDVSLSMLKRLDFITRDFAKDASHDDLVVRIFLNKNLKKNDYGEAVYYREDGEILAALHPIQGRLVLWNASLPYVYKPPAMSYIQGQYDITIKLTTSQDKLKQVERRRQDNAKLTEQHKKQGFPLADGAKLPKLDFAKYEIKRFHDSQGREVAVFDGLVNREDLDTLRLYLLQHNSAYRYQPYDDDAVEDHDNVSWIASLEVDDFITSRLWELVKAIATYMSDEDTWFPYDVSMNIIRNSHHTRIHEDCEENEYEYTFLMYLNPDWDPEMYGETAFFELRQPPNRREVEKGKEEYDWIGSVSPRYGRIAIFRGIIPHSARPPSPDFKGARYTFACKVGRNYRIARAKSLRETIENAEPGDPDFDLMMELTEGLYDRPSPEKPIEFIDTALRKRKRERNERVEEEKMEIVRAISSKPA